MSDLQDFLEDGELAPFIAAVRDIPAPDPARRAVAISAAVKKNEEMRQETRSFARPIVTNSPETFGAAIKGVCDMTKSMIGKVGMLGGGAAALALSVIVVNNGMAPDTGGFVSVSVPPTVKAASDIAAPEGAMPEVAMPEVSMNVRPAVAPVMESLALADPAGKVAPAGRMAVQNEMQADMVMAAPSLAVRSAPQGAMAKGLMAAPESFSVTNHAVPSMADDMIAPPNEVSNDKFDGKPVNPVKVAAEEPVSTFSIDVDTASYAYARRQINWGNMPMPAQVRIEEMVNYFSYGYAAPEVGDAHPFSTNVTVFEAPWNPDRDLVRIGIQGIEPEVKNRPDLDLVFLIDTSGSMRSQDKLGLLRKSLIMALGELRPTDRVGIVTYAGSSGVKLEMTSVDDIGKGKIVMALNSLNAGGSTAGAAGLRAAYGLLNANEEDGRIGRVLLATDGDFNVGMSGTEEMKDFIAKKRDSGKYLTVLGFGQGNYNDALMQTLAQNGNGQAAYIDSLTEANKVLVDQMAGAMFPIANDVKIQVEWNPTLVSEYRLIGYETRALAREDFNNDKVDAGEIGAGHQVTALYEVTPADAASRAVDPLRYGQTDKADVTDNGELGFLKLRYKNPGETTSILVETPILDLAEAPDEDARFATAIAGFAQLMKDDKYLGDWGWDDAIALAQEARGDDRFGYRNEALSLMRLASSLAGTSDN